MKLIEGYILTLLLLLIFVIFFIFGEKPIGFPQGTFGDISATSALKIESFNYTQFLYPGISTKGARTLDSLYEGGNFLPYYLLSLIEESMVVKVYLWSLLTSFLMSLVGLYIFNLLHLMTSNRILAFVVTFSVMSTYTIQLVSDAILSEVLSLLAYVMLLHGIVMYDRLGPRDQLYHKAILAALLCWQSISILFSYFLISLYRVLRKGSVQPFFSSTAMKTIGVFVFGIGLNVAFRMFYEMYMQEVALENTSVMMLIKKGWQFYSFSPNSMGFKGMIVEMVNMGIPYFGHKPSPSDWIYIFVFLGLALTSLMRFNSFKRHVGLLALSSVSYAYLAKNYSSGAVENAVFLIGFPVACHACLVALLPGRIKLALIPIVIICFIHSHTLVKQEKTEAASQVEQTTRDFHEIRTQLKELATKNTFLDISSLPAYVSKEAYTYYLIGFLREENSPYLITADRSYNQQFLINSLTPQNFIFHLYRVQ